MPLTPLFWSVANNVCPRYARQTSSNRFYSVSKKQALVAVFIAVFFIIAISLLLTKAPGTNPLLISNSSGYLRAHAEDPIAWQPLTRDAVREAQQMNKPIVISSGYQSCYWCYRMKTDTFSDTDLAQVINDAFIPILIDSQSHVGIDQQLQWITQQQKGHGGWPLTMILTPDGLPIIGFNYIEPDSLTLALNRFLTLWETDANKVVSLAQQESARWNQLRNEQDQPLTEVNYPKLFTGFIDQLNVLSDHEYGGFGRGEKYPYVPQLDALLTLYSLNPSPTLRGFLEKTLSAMLNGPMHDHIEGGFFRYADNRDWTSPHYEKMLYTQALIGRHLIRAGGILQRQDFVDGGVRTLTQMVRAFKDKDGLYIASFSAVDTSANRHRQGGYYLWSQTEMRRHIGKDWPLQIKNLLADNEQWVLPMPFGDSAKDHQTNLLNIRNNRERAKDEKKILAWQGLVLSALSHGATVSSTLANAAQELAHVLLPIAQGDNLMHLVGQAIDDSTPGEFSDYVYLASGLVDWWQITNDTTLLATTQTLLTNAHKQFNHQHRWLSPDHYGILAAPAVLAVKDDQLPSPSAIWLSLAWGLGDMNTVGAAKLTDLADTMGHQLPRALISDGFFYPTTLSTLIARQWHLGNMTNLKSLSQ